MGDQKPLGHHVQWCGKAGSRENFSEELCFLLGHSELDLNRLEGRKQGEQAQ